MLYAAFYKHKGNWIDYAIRFRTASKYSHVEIYDSETKLWYSSSPRDNGVRTKVINPKKDRWDFLPLPWVQKEHLQKVYLENKGKGYDFLGVMVGQLFVIPVHSKEKMFCSEFTAKVSGFNHASSYSPETFFRAVLNILAICYTDQKKR
jgi:hypothetical protein